MYREAKQRHLIHLNLTDNLLISDGPRRSSPANVDHIIELYIQSQKLSSKALTSHRQTYDMPVILISFTVITMVSHDCIRSLTLKQQA